jgi:site-specific recombinase XerD
MIGLRGLSQVTVSDRGAEARRFLDWLGYRAARGELADLTPVDVDAYVKDRAGSLRRRTLKGLATNIRSFLRWLHMTGQTTRDLSSTVLTPSLYAFESIPSALRAQEVRKVLATTRKDCTPKGIRDYAILMLLSTYGVRAGEVVALSLDDIDWRKEVIRIRHSKTGSTSYLPLLPEVGEALLKYLQKSRPKTTIREIFIRCHAPYRPFEDGSSLYGLVQCRLAAAGVVPSGKRGPHAFRHARAVSMLRATVPVKEIGDVLGHRAVDSTLVYLKLATEDLRAVALEIPAEVKP